MTNDNRPEIPNCAWKRPIGLDWEKPYKVRSKSNLDDGPWHGATLGGFGAGCIGRSPRGDFNLWHLDGGEHTFQSFPACQFSVFEETGLSKQAYALCTEPPADGTLSAWKWYPASLEVGTRNTQSSLASTGNYYALYPRSWFVYEGVFQANLTCEQFSPIWPGNYQESSYPIAIFEWTAHNPTDKPITISIMLTWQNMVGWFTNANKTPQVSVRDDGSPVYEYEPRLGDSTGNFDRWVENEHRHGCLLDRFRPDIYDVGEGEGQWALATLSNPSLEVFYHTRWNPAGDGSDIWQSFGTDGSLSDRENELAAVTGEQIGAALAVRFTIRPGKTRKIPFILAWDLPVTEFAAGIEYYRRYTDFFGRNGKNAWSMVRTALKHYETWRERIQAWQQPILDREDLPSWFKMALFNELYDLASGGTLWSAADERDPVGQFAVLECLDYRWYESLDVRLYGSFPVLMFWPKLEKAVLEAYSRAIKSSDRTPRIIGYNQASAIRKITGATPHDLGAPNEHPWEKTNYTSYQDCNLWKDLSCDFVLQVYRYFVFTGKTDVEFLRDCWSSVVETLAYLKTFDLDGDSIPENSGAPDQTFDDWQLKGVSAYCGGLWLAALSAAIAIGNILGKQEEPHFVYGEERNPTPNPSPSTGRGVGVEEGRGVGVEEGRGVGVEEGRGVGVEEGRGVGVEEGRGVGKNNIQETIDTYKSWLEKAIELYQQKLWNGQYYKLDSESGSDVVMADQLCGQFYARLLGLPDIVPAECALSALKTVYEACFLKFHNGQIGAANGVKLDGSPEKPDATHPLEVWTGINFGLAAFLVQMGMKAEAFQLTEAVVRQIYDNGLQFRTPEAITAVGTFRASHYLRPMAIWAIYGVLTDFPN